MTDRELMQQALEALGHTIRTTYADARFDAVLVNNAITALRERLTQPQRTHWEGCEEVHPECKRPATREEKIVRPGVYEVTGPLHVVCQCDKCKAQPEREPFGYFQLDLRLDAWVQNRNSNKGVAFYTTPPRREWVGLTDEEKLHLEIMGGKSDVMLAEAIEAKLKEKNNAP